MIIKWDKGVLRYKDEPGIEDGTVRRRWTAGSVEFSEHWFRAIDGESDSLTRYDHVTHVSFYGIVVSWRAKGWCGLWTPKAREIYDEIMRRARTLFLEGKGMGQLVGDIS